jgi:hypothetical protein
VLTKTTLAAAAIGMAAFMAPVSSAPLAPPSLPVEGLAEGLGQRLLHYHRHDGHRHRHHHQRQSSRRVLLFPQHARAPDHHGHGHGRAHLLYGVPFSYGSYDNATECHWLRRRALGTGSSDWWDRFYACLYVYGYN